MKLKWESNYKKIRAQKRPAIGLSLRMVLLVTMEFLGSVIFSYISYFSVNGILRVIIWIINKLITELLAKVVDRVFTIPDITIPLFVFLFPTIFIIGIVGTYFMSLWLFYPLKKLRQGFSKIADGDFSVRLSTRSFVKEIQELYSGFNLMADGIESTEVLQSDFVSNASHEFRTPINAIEGYATLLSEDSDNLSPEQKEYLDKIIFNTHRLSSLTGSILLLSKIESRSITAEGSVFSLDEQIREAIVALEPLWEKKNVELDVMLDDAEYYGNEKLMHHVWSNLISNAIKFGPEGGTVAIRLKKEKKLITVTVDDCGEGLSAEAQAHLFDKFYQGDSSHKAEGNGLGLALVKKIVALEEGEISAENLSGGGCRFTVRLKVKKAPRKKTRNKIIDKIFKK